MRERGSAMLTAVVAVMVLILISGIFFSFVNSQFKMQTAEEKALRAYYLAEAGTNYGIAWMINKVKNESVINESFDIPKSNPKRNPFGADYGGYFYVNVTVPIESVNVSDGVVTYIYKITAKSTGVFNGITRVLQKDYAITVTPDID